MRNRMEQLCDILAAMREGETRPTRLMHRTNTNYMVLRDCLFTLEEEGLISVRERGKHLDYRLTEKGSLSLDILRESFRVTGIRPRSDYLHSVISR